MINIMLQTLPGIAVTYQGEEMALENVEISYEDTGLILLQAFMFLIFGCVSK
jgi:hypothetical protein